MKERFRGFNKKFKNTYEKKAICKIILFGSYRPSSEESFLRQIKKDLQEDGYEKTFLIKDLPDLNNRTIRDKSIVGLEFSDINIFIVTFRGKKVGSTVELEYIIQNASLLSFKTIVFFEVKNENGEKIKSLSQLQIDGLLRANIKFYPFERESYSDLFKSIRAKIWSKHYHYVITEKRY
jgi:hypothetical protein